MTALRSEPRHLAVLVTRDLRELLRDPITLVLTLVAPVLAALIASAGLGSPAKIDASIVVAGTNGRLGDSATLSGLGSTEFDGQRPVHVRVAADAVEARRAVIDGSAAAAVILPSDEAPAETPVMVVVNRNAHLVGDIAISAAQTLAARLSVSNSGAVDAPATDTIVADTESPGRRPLNAGELYGPVIAVFFLFLASGFVARSLTAERERGTLARLRALPISTLTIVAGKTLAMLVVAASEFAAVLVAMRIAYGARWGSLVAVGAVTLALALAVAAIAVMIASFARTYQSSAALVAFTALLFAVLGGSLVPLRNLPDVMRSIASVTPNGIAISTIHDIAANGRGLVDILHPLLTILAFAVVVGALGFARLRRTLES